VIVYVATTNPGKLRELRELTAGSYLHLISDDLYEEVDEDEQSYAENAALKARSYRRILLEHGVQACVIADDSGLEVHALQNRPGILSARYGGQVSWEERRQMLLAELAPHEDRTARFVCALHFIDEHGHEISVSGTVDGLISEADQGERGYPPLGKTFAELRIREKNAISHRARAVGDLLHMLSDSEEESKAASIALSKIV
jgi:XTP/dITP diphosphohydrolase